jgi:hypothetical protein
MVAQERWAGGAAAGDTCPAPMTRAALLTLRNAGQLNIQCHYIITDHVQNRLVAGTYIELHATDASTLSMHVSVKSTYDNLAWEGRYDIDTGLVVELRDNRNNVVIGATAVGNFDWGNANYLECRVENATWNVTYGIGLPMTRVRVLDRAILTTTNMVLGPLQDVEVSKAATVDLTGASLAVISSTFTEGATLTANGFTAGGVGINNSSFRDSSSVVFGPGSGQVQLINSTVDAYGRINHTATGTFTFNNTVLGSTALISHLGAAGPMAINNSRLHGGNTTIDHQFGTVNVQNSTFDVYGRIIKSNAASTGLLMLSYCHVTAGAYIQQQALGTVSLSGVIMSGGGYIDIQAGANTTAGFTVTNSNIADLGNITVTAGSVGGVVTITGSSFKSRGNVFKNNVGPLTISSGDFDSTGRLQILGPRGLNVNGCKVTTGGRIVAAAGNPAAVDIITHTTVTDDAIAYFNATGAVANQIQYSRIAGLTGEISFGGTNTGAVISRTTADNGIVRFNSNTVALTNVLDIGARDQAVITVANCTAAFGFRYSTAQSYGRINITGKSATGIVYGVDVQNNGSFNVTGAAADSVYCSVRNGQINHNGGTLRAAHKRMDGILTTGAFNHSNIIHEANASKTLTVANSNRADYMGLAAQLV